MKILLVHNYYKSSSPSGEDTVFKNEVKLLKKNNINVVTYTAHNDEIIDIGGRNKVKYFIESIWSARKYIELKALIEKEKPDIVHFHNIWYLISPSCYYACKNAGVPVVQTLHNYRIFCTSGLLFRNGLICEMCIPEHRGKITRLENYVNRAKIIQNSLRFRCYKNSLKYSFAIALGEYLHWVLGTWSKQVDAYIVPSEFGRRKFIKAGLNASKLFVKPNFLIDATTPIYENNDYIIFIGRLSLEKGIDILIDALTKISAKKSNNLKLKIIGDGPLLLSLKEKIKTIRLNSIEFIGRAPAHEMRRLINYSCFTVVPSICYEMFPMAIIESFAGGKPVLASKLGAVEEIVDNGKTGLLFEPGNSSDLAEKIKFMLENKKELIQMGKNSRKEFEEKYTDEKNINILLNIYKNVLDKMQKV